MKIEYSEKLMHSQKTALKAFKKDNSDFVGDFKVDQPEEKYFSKASGSILLWNDSQIVGRVQIFIREIAHKGVKFKLGGIGSVRVVKSERGKGHATKMLKYVKEVLLKKNCDLLFLVTDPGVLGHLYKPFGFVRMRSKSSFRGKSGKVYTQIGGMVAEGMSKEVFELVRDSEEVLFIGDGAF